MVGQDPRGLRDRRGLGQPARSRIEVRQQDERAVAKIGGMDMAIRKVRVDEHIRGNARDEWIQRRHHRKDQRIVEIGFEAFEQLEHRLDEHRLGLGRDRIDARVAQIAQSRPDLADATELDHLERVKEQPFIDLG